MEALEILEDEHTRVERALDQAVTALGGSPVEVARAVNALENLVDRRHLPKLDLLLHLLLADSLDLVAIGPIQILRRNHELAQAYLRAARSALAGVVAGRASEGARLRRAIESYAELMRAYLPRERVLLRLASSTLDDERDGDLLARFGAIDRESEEERVTTAGGRNVPPVDPRTLAARPEEVGDTVFSMRSGGVLFEDPHHQALWLHDFGRGLAVQANTFLIQHDGEGMILDPGGPKVYPDVFAETTLRLGQGSLKYIFLSHQDPDIGTSLNAWLMDTDAVAYISRLWTRFLPHFGIDDLLEQRLHAIPDDGLSVHLAGAELRFIPAHFLHSPGNFQVYDPTARILFSGDLGAAPSCDESLVSDFDSHIPRMLGFHRRYMASRRAMQVWADRVRHLDIETIAPQHGAVFRGRPMVKRFIDWCSNLECGVDLL